MLRFKSFCSCQTLKFSIQTIYYQSTNVTPAEKENKKQETQSKYPPLDTKFDQYQIAYRYRNNIELLRGYFIYRIFSFNILVNNQDKIARWGHRILGDRLFKSVFRQTAFNHFVAGETSQDIIPVIENLQKYNVKPILDYSVESDETNSSSSSNDIDRMNDDNTTKFVECIKTSHDVCGPNNLIAIKVTALIRPNVLKKFSALLKLLDDRLLLSSLFEIINQDNSKEKFNLCFEQFRNKSLTNDRNQIFSSDDINEIYKLLIRLNKIAQACVANKISIMVDAEQTYFQTAINYFATELQRYYNKYNVPFVYGTYQCYLKNTFDSLKHDLDLSIKGNYIFAAKLVRGAYMDQERRLSRENDYEDPINPSFEATTQMYNKCLDEVLKTTLKRKPDQIRIMIASHNEDTIRYALDKMKEFNINRDSSIVSFASLYGMSDYVSFTLANSGYDAYKYVPYGPIEALQPYLFRRAQENRSIFEKAAKDRRFHFKAFKDRIFNSKN